jgi:hypothetical protein
MVKRVEANRIRMLESSEIQPNPWPKETLARWYLEMADSVLELPMHNQRITLTTEDFHEYFKFLYQYEGE